MILQKFLQEKLNFKNPKKYKFKFNYHPPDLVTAFTVGAHITKGAKLHKSVQNSLTVKLCVTTAG
jgi:hypothetical protein